MFRSDFRPPSRHGREVWQDNNVEDQCAKKNPNHQHITSHTLHARNKFSSETDTETDGTRWGREGRREEGQTSEDFSVSFVAKVGWQTCFVFGLNPRTLTCESIHRDIHVVPMNVSKWKNTRGVFATEAWCGRAKEDWAQEMTMHPPKKNEVIVAS